MAYNQSNCQSINASQQQQSERDKQKHTHAINVKMLENEIEMDNKIVENSMGGGGRIEERRPWLYMANRRVWQVDKTTSKQKNNERK